MMKKTILAIAAAIMMSANVAAQDKQEQVQQPQQPDRTEVIKQQTDQTVKDYGLDEAQAAKLLTLNTEYAEKIPMMFRGPRGGQRGQRPQANRQRPQRPDGAVQGQRPPRGERPQMDREEMRKNMEAYNAELQKIMTEEQYKKYQEDVQKRMQRGPQGGPGQRRERPQHN